MTNDDPHLALLWPNPRAAALASYRREPGRDPEPLDGLSYLEDLGFRCRVVEVGAFPLNPGARRGSLWAGIDPLRSLRLLRAARRLDAIIAVGDSSAALYLGWAELARSGRPVILIDPALDDVYEHRIRMQSFVLPRCARVIVFGQNQRAALRDRFGDRVRTCFIPHRVDTDFFRPEPTAGRSGQPRVVCVGDDQARDFATVHAAARDVTADFRCKTRSRPELSPLPNLQILTDRLSFAGLRNLYREADVAIVSTRPTIHACGINSLLEAMAMAIPTVVTRSEALADYIEDGVNCLAVPPGDPSAMNQAIRALLGDPLLAERIGAGGRRFVEEHCALPVYAARLAAVLKDVLDETS